LSATQDNATPVAPNQPNPIPVVQPPDATPPPQPKASGAGWGGFAVGLGILVAAGYYLIK
jgi:hypothetical protein